MKKQWLFIALAFVLPVLGILVWWGMFATVVLEQTEAGPYRYAYLESQGSYTKTVDKHREANNLLRQQGISPGASITLIYDDPRSTAADARVARTGFLIGDEVTPQAPLLVDTVPAQPVIRVSVKAHPLFAYGKAYGTLLKFTKERALTLRLPTVEFYDDSMLTVEMPLESRP